MPKHIIKDAYVSVNSHDLSRRVASVAVIQDADDVDVSTMGTGVHEHLAGLRNDRFEVTFIQDFDGSVDDALSALVADADTQPSFTMIVKAFNATVTTTNPSWTSTDTILLNYQPLSGNVGDRSEAQVTFPSNSGIVRATS